MSPAWLSVALLLGLVHAGHCAAMCGPFALRAGAGPRPLAGALVYLAGKTGTYVLLGALAGAAGASAAALGAQGARVLGWVVGCSLLIAGARRLLAPPGTGWLDRRLGPALARAAAFVRGPGGVRARRHPLLDKAVLGAVTGALPCGAVYLAVLQSLAFGDAARGVLFMAGFGAGTAPALLAVALAGHGVRGRLPEHRVRQAAGVLVVLAGLLTLWRAGWPGGDAACPACLA